MSGDRAAAAAAAYWFLLGWLETQVERGEPMTASEIQAMLRAAGGPTD